MPSITPEFFQMVVSTKLPHLKFCFVWGEKNLNNTSPCFLYEQVFDMLEDLPVRFHNAIRLLDAAADAEGNANIPNIGARNCEKGGVSQKGAFELPGIVYHIIDPEFDCGVYTYNISIA